MFLRLLGIALVFSACKTTTTAANYKKKLNAGEFNENGSPLLQREVTNGKSQGDLPQPRAEDFKSTAPALFPVEANGEYEIGCQDKIAGVNLRDDQQFLTLPTNGTPYIVKTYYWIENNQFAITFVAFTGASCSNTQAALKPLSFSSMIIAFELTKASDQTMQAKTLRFIYNTKEEDEVVRFNKMHFCGFEGWQTNVTYDATNRDCNQAFFESYKDGSTRRATQNFTGNKSGVTNPIGTITWDAATSTLSATPLTGGTATKAIRLKTTNGAKSNYFLQLNELNVPTSR